MTEDQETAARRGKRLRKESSSALSIEEMHSDDMGYDADIEALQPDGYEEPDSEVEVMVTSKRKFHSIDDELAARMKHLGSERSGTNSPMIPSSARGRKRRSLHDEFTAVSNNGHSDLEIMEVPPAEGAARSPPSKRRRRNKPDGSDHKSDAPLSRHAHDQSLYRVSKTNDEMELT